MSGNVGPMNGDGTKEITQKPAPGSHIKTDRRILRTRDTLGDALVALMHEKSFDDITVCRRCWTAPG